VRLLIKHKFPSDQLAAKILVPALIVAAEQDAVIPPVHAQHLFDAWAGPKSFEVLKKVGHNDIELHEQYYPRINAYLDQLTAR
jgi:pimeloyl-ACP methyl ester carboxylesterase